MNKQEILAYKKAYPDHYSEFFKPILSGLNKNYLTEIENETPVEIQIEKNQSNNKPIVDCSGGSISSTGHDRCDCECNDISFHNEIHAIADEVRELVLFAGVNHCSSNCMGKGVANIHLNLDKDTMVLDFNIHGCCHTY